MALVCLILWSPARIGRLKFQIRTNAPRGECLVFSINDVLSRPQNKSKLVTCNCISATWSLLSFNGRNKVCSVAKIIFFYCDKFLLSSTWKSIKFFIIKLLLSVDFIYWFFCSELQQIKNRESNPNQFTYSTHPHTNIRPQKSTNIGFDHVKNKHSLFA